jgi:hypothetical protein
MPTLPKGAPAAVHLLCPPCNGERYFGLPHETAKKTEIKNTPRNSAVRVRRLSGSTYLNKIPGKKPVLVGNGTKDGACHMQLLWIPHYVSIIIVGPKVNENSGDR